jgi:hypothetical protein
MLGEIEWLYSRIVDRCPAMPTSEMGHSRRFRDVGCESALPPRTDIVSLTGHVRKVPILLQKSFWGAERKFLEPLMRLAPRDVRDLIVSQKNDHGPSYWRYGALQPWSGLKYYFREILGVVRFSTFATKSANKRLMHLSNFTAYRAGTGRAD